MAILSNGCPFTGGFQGFRVSGRLEDLARLGDTYGGFNALITGLAFVALLYTIRQQGQMIAIQQKELKEATEQASVNAKATREAADAARATLQFELLRLEFDRACQNIQIEIEMLRTALSRWREPVSSRFQGNGVAGWIPGRKCRQQRRVLTMRHSVNQHILVRSCVIRPD